MTVDLRYRGIGLNMQEESRHTHIYTHIHTYTHIYTHTHTYTHMCIHTSCCTVIFRWHLIVMPMRSTTSLRRHTSSPITFPMIHVPTRKSARAACSEMPLPQHLHADQCNKVMLIRLFDSKIVEIGVRCFFSLTACVLPNSQLMALLL